MEFSCSICNYTSKVKNSIIRHISNRNIECFDKNPTMVENECIIKCEYCNRIMSTFANLKRHLKTCKIKKINLEEENRILKEKLAISEALNKKHSTVIGTQNNQINIVLSPWNDPKLPADVEKYYKEAVKKIFLAVPTLIKYIHFNTDHPENHNICIKNGRNKKAIVHNGKEWETVDEDRVIQTLINDYEQTLEDYSDMKKLTFTKEYKKIKDRDGEDKVYEDLHTEVKRIIYDRNHMIKIKN